MKLKLIYLLCLLLIASACSPVSKVDKPVSEVDEVTENPADFDLRTNQTEYIAESETGFSYGFSLTAKLENTTDQTLYLDLCYPDDTSPIYSVTLAEESDKKSSWNPAWACVGHSESIVLEPGQTRIDTYAIEGPTVSQNGQPVGEIEGLFKLSYRTLECADSGVCTPSSISSNAFKIELAD